MNSIEITAKTTEEAISEGLEKLGVGISDVKVDIIEEGSKGLFGFFGSRLAKIRLTVFEDEEGDEVKEIFSHAAEPAKPEPKPVKQAEPAKAEKKQPAKKAKPEPKTAEKTEPKPVKTAKARPEKKADAPTQETEAPAREPVPVTPAEQLDPATKAGKAQDFLQNVTKLMGLEGIAVHVKTDDEGYLRVDMQGDTSGILIGRRGETLDALQYLTSLYVNKGQSDYTRVTLDTENYRAKREDTLVRLANRMANRAVKTGRRVSMEPMNPYERRILHSALQGNENVETHSEGEEPNRHVVITPKKADA